MSKGYDIFIKRAMAMHGTKFDYSKSNFINQKTPITIICPIHGDFSQSPDKHIAKNAKGCAKCWNDMKRKLDYSTRKKKQPKPPESFLFRANKKFENKYIYNLSNYSGITGNDIIIKCPIHGEHANSPINHLISNTGCPECGICRKNQTKTKDYDIIIEQFNEKYNFRYDYPDYNRLIYKNKKSKIDIICKMHGLFEKKAQKHLAGQGCFQCRIEEMIRDNILVGGYSEELFVKKPELKDCPAKLYYLNINNGEVFKIGISRVSVHNRIKGIKSKSNGEVHSIEILKVEDDTLYECFIKEQKILSEFSSLRIYKSWSTELFSKDILF